MKTLFQISFIFCWVSLVSQPLPSFDSIQLNGGGIVHIEQSDRDEIFPNVEVKKNGSRLFITMQRASPYHLKVRNLKNLTLSGPSKIIGKSPLSFPSFNLFANRSDVKLTLFSNYLRVTCGRESRVSIEGSTQDLDLFVRETAGFQGLGLTADKVVLDARNGAKVAIGPSTLLTGSIKEKSRCIYRPTETYELNNETTSTPILIPDVLEEESRYWKTRHWIRPEARKETEPYLLPYDHPIRPALDDLLSRRPRPMQAKCFWKGRFQNDLSRTNLVASDPRFEGYVIKGSLDNARVSLDQQKVPIWKFLLERRLKGALAVNEYIRTHPLCEKYLTYCPKKWLYPLPKADQTMSLNDYTFHRYFDQVIDNDFLLIAEFRDIKRVPSDHLAIKKGTDEESLAIRSLIDDLRIADANASNLCIEKNTGKWILTDTESVFEARPKQLAPPLKRISSTKKRKTHHKRLFK